MKEARLLILLVGLLCVALGVVLNAPVLITLMSSDGVIGPSARIAIWLFDIAMVVAGLALIRYRNQVHKSAFGDLDRTLKSILAVGIVVRVVVYIFLQPNNNDPHLDVVEFIVENGSLPITGRLGMAFHPPLYYIIAALFALTGSAKFVQFLSLALSVANLILLYWLIRTTTLLKDDTAKCHALALAALLPQFVLFSAFVSNDTLAFLVGTLIIFQAVRFIDRPTQANLIWLGVLVGAGLSTKGTLMAMAPPAGLLIIVMGGRQKARLAQHLGSLALFSVIVLGAGSYKFIENTVYRGKPILSGNDLNLGYLQRQQGTYQGVKSIVDVNLVKLVRNPFYGERTKHSIPLLMYGTFWYSYLQESNFNATRHGSLSLVPRAIYVVGVVPTVLIVIGTATCVWRNRSPFKAVNAPAFTFNLRVQEALIVTVLLLSLGLVLLWGFQHDAWSFFQGRLLFQSMFPIAILFALGFQTLSGRSAGLRHAMNLCLISAYFVFGAYLAIEVAVHALRACCS